VLAIGAHQRVSDFVIGDALPLLFVESPALAFRAGDDFFDSLFNVLVGNGLGLAACGQKRRLIQRVGQIGAQKSGRRLRDRAKFDIRSQWFVTSVDFRIASRPSRSGASTIT